MSETDWRRVPTQLTDRFQVVISPDSVRLVFGHAVDKDDFSFHTGLVMTRANAEELCQLIQDLLAKTSAGAPTAATGGGTIH
jgi:hypothetical protein